MDQILSSLTKVKSVWDILREVPSENMNWVMLIDNLIPLFRKNTFFDLVSTKSYYPQSMPNCRYYIKPNDGSCGKGIQIVNFLPPNPIEGYTICPEIITPPIIIGTNKYKYDYRVWIGIQSDLKYFICPTLIKRVSTVPFSLDTMYGSFTNTSLYSEQFDHQDSELYDKINMIVMDVLKSLLLFTPGFSVRREENIPDTDTKLMLTGWDFIENESGELFVLEVNCNPGINIQHTQVMTEFLNLLLSNLNFF